MGWAWIYYSQIPFDLPDPLHPAPAEDQEQDRFLHLTHHWRSTEAPPTAVDAALPDPVVASEPLFLYEVA